MIIQDVLLDTDLDLQIADGDFVVGESTTQHQALLLLASPGEFRESPLIGVALNRYLLDNDRDAPRAEIRRQFELDGMKVASIDMTTGTVPTIDASYA